MLRFLKDKILSSTNPKCSLSLLDWASVLNMCFLFYSGSWIKKHKTPFYLFCSTFVWSSLSPAILLLLFPLGFYPENCSPPEQIKCKLTYYIIFFNFYLKNIQYMFIIKVNIELYKMNYKYSLRASLRTVYFKGCGYLSSFLACFWLNLWFYYTNFLVWNYNHHILIGKCYGIAAKKHRGENQPLLTWEGILKKTPSLFMIWILPCMV